MLGDLPVLDGGQDQNLLGHAGVVQGPYQLGGATACRGRRLEDDAAAGGQGGHDPAHGDGHREVPGGGDNRHGHGLEARPGHVLGVLQLQGGRGVVMAEIDGL